MATNVEVTHAFQTGVFILIFFIPLLFQIAGIIIFFDMTYQQEHMSDMS
jgi:hypothetical protein